MAESLESSQMNDTSILSPEAIRQTPVATVERAGYINKYGSRVVVAPEIALERNIRGTYQEIEDEVDRLTRIRNELEHEISQAGIVGSEFGYDYVRLNAGLEYLVDQLNDQGATINGEQVTVAGLIAPDARIKVKNTRIGNFRIEGIRTFKGGQDLLEEVSLQDNALYLTAIGNTGIDIDGLPTAFEALNSTIEARPETEAAAKISSQEVEELNAEIDRLQADADVLRASISEVDTKGKQPDPANPAAQMSILEGVLQRNITDNRFDFRMRTNRLRETRERLAPTIAAVSEYESPEVLSGRNMQATVSSVPLTVEGDYILPETGLDPISSPPSEQPELALDPTARPPSEQPGFMPQSGPVDPVSMPPSEMPGFNAAYVPSSNRFVDTGGLNPEDHQDVVDAMTSTFGIRAAFWNLDANKLQIGVDRNGGPVPADSEDAVRVQHLLEYLVENKITSDARVLAVVEQTAWYRTTNASMREFDAKYGGLDNFLDLNPENQRDKVGDILDQVEDGFRQLGVQVDEERMIEIAATIDYLGYDMDDVEIATRVLAEAQEAQYQFDAETASFTEFASTKDAVEATARSYYINLPNSMVTQYAQQIFTGELRSEQLHSMFREQAQARFGNDQRIQNALQAGMTLDAYFAPYAGELEKELGRPVDLFTEFPEVIEQMGSDGVARPMTYAEMRTFARQQPEWAQSTRGQDAAYNMVFEMGKLFGVEA